MGTTQPQPFAVCLSFPISTRKLMTPVLESRGSQVPADNCFCVLLHSPLEKRSLEVLSCTKNKVLVARRRGISTFPDFFLQTEKHLQTGDGACDCLPSFHLSPAPRLGLSPSPTKPFALSPCDGWRRLDVSGLVLPCLQHENTSFCHPSSL